MLAYSRSEGPLYLFGGGSASGSSETTWVYDPSVPEWRSLTATGPSARYDGALTPTDGGRSLRYNGSAPVPSSGACGRANPSRSRGHFVD